MRVDRFGVSQLVTILVKVMQLEPLQEVNKKGWKNTQSNIVKSVMTLDVCA